MQINDLQAYFEGEISETTQSVAGSSAMERAGGGGMDC